jgi:DNA repair protein RAD50
VSQVWKDAAASAVPLRVLTPLFYDVDRFFRALDASPRRMADINARIQDLWHLADKCLHIDGISIETDDAWLRVEQSCSTMLRRKRRAHRQYNVMQWKLDHRVSMRGRCSARQKALASLVMRCAIAESYRVGGVLALDEPAAGLDPTSIQTLAQAIGALAVRTAKESVELVVLTNDATFAEALGRSGAVSVTHRGCQAVLAWRALSADAACGDRVRLHDVKL